MWRSKVAVSTRVFVLRLPASWVSRIASVRMASTTNEKGTDRQEGGAMRLLLLSQFSRLVRLSLRHLYPAMHSHRQSLLPADDDVIQQPHVHQSQGLLQANGYSPVSCR